jgi:hypothetical protein
MTVDTGEALQRRGHDRRASFGDVLPRAARGSLVGARARLSFTSAPAASPASGAVARQRRTCRLAGADHRPGRAQRDPDAVAQGAPPRLGRRCGWPEAHRLTLDPSTRSSL